MTTRQIQQLHYNGHRLFCPDHPERELEEAKASGGLPFSMLCTAPVPGKAGSTCMKSAEWKSKEAMQVELKQSH